MSFKLFFLLVLIAISGPAAAQDEAPDELEPITVEPFTNPLDESMERLRIMMEDAPCLGCGPIQDAARENPYLEYGRYLSFLTGAGYAPPVLSPEQRAEARLVGDWRIYERDPNN